MNINDRFERLKKSFKKLHNQLKHENENNWSWSIGTICHELDCAISESEKQNAIDEITITFKTIYAGNGSFSDYCIWRDDSEERVKINKEFGSLIDEIWFLITQQRQ